MEQMRIQKMLREQFCFRVIILAFAGGACILYGGLGSQASNGWGIVLGIAASALVWALVELFDFFVSTYHRYCLERSQFILLMTRKWSEIRGLLSENRDEIEWKPIKHLIELLYEEVANYPFCGGVYAVSKEFEDIANYINRMSWRTHGCFWNLDNIPVGSHQVQSLYDMLIVTERGKCDGVTFLETFSQLDSEMKELQKTEMSFEKFGVPEHVCSTQELGTMWEHIDTDQNTYVTLKFRPKADFWKNFGEKPVHGSFLTVLSLIFRKISEKQFS